MKDLMDLYSDYLLSSFNQTTATGLSNLLDGAISHDEITRLLSKNDFCAKDLWQKVKPLVKLYKDEDACLIFDDTIIEKPHTKENALNCWHWDHCNNRNVKGINLLTAFYYSKPPNAPEALRVPVSFELILKTIEYCEIKTKKEKRRSEYTKNELFQKMVTQSIKNQLTFKYVLADTWFSSSSNMLFVHNKNKKFIFDMKSNRLAALSEKDRNAGRWTQIRALDIPNNSPVQVWLKGLTIPVLLTKQVFKNKNNNTGVRFLVSNDFDLTDDDFMTLYKKRWSVEEYHKSLKQNASISKSPARMVKTQSNHLFGAMMAYIKLEKLKLNYQLNHFAIKSKIYLSAIKAAFNELSLLKIELN